MYVTTLIVLFIIKITKKSLFSYFIHHHILCDSKFPNFFLNFLIFQNSLGVRLPVSHTFSNWQLQTLLGCCTNIITLQWNYITMKLKYNYLCTSNLMTAYYHSDIFVCDRWQLNWLFWCNAHPFAAHKFSL